MMFLRSLLVVLSLATWLQAAERVPWTTSRVIGSPEPPLPFKTERIWPAMSFEHPVFLAVQPDAPQMFVGEQAGKVWAFAMRDDVTEKHLVFDVKASITYPTETSFDALYGWAFDPEFATNRYVYLCYVLKPQPNEVLPEGSRVSRFVLKTADRPTIDPASETILLTYRAGGHNGGCLEFGPDGYLYISTGDGAGPNPPDQLGTGQDCSDLLSSILRIDVRGATAEKPYRVPALNPFVDRPGIRPEIWAYGFRNPWKMTFDRKTGELWVGDVGWDQWELVQRVTKGANFGWAAYEGRQPILPNLSPGPSVVQPPTIALPHSIAASVTGGYVYRGQKFPELAGQYIFGDWETKRIWAVDHDASGQPILRDLADSGLQIVAFGQDHDGELYVADYGQGVMHALVRNRQALQPSTFPQKLSETGIFAKVSGQTPNPGVLPFEINQPQWADFATAERWIAIPGSDSVIWHPQDRAIPGSMFSRQHDFPEGTVLVKTLSLEMTAGDPKSAKKIETQLLHFDGVNWLGYSYAWNDDQTDAVLVPSAGQQRTLRISDAKWSGGERVQRWSFASRTQCISCHTPWAQHALAFQPQQLHRPVMKEGQTVSQLKWLEEQGYYRRVDGQQQTLEPLSETSLNDLKPLARADDPAATVHNLARSYLHVHCSHCHRFNGGGAGSFELLSKLTDEQLLVIDTPPRQGNLGIDGANIVTPGFPAQSLLYVRMAKFGRGRMPHLGAEFVDEQGLGWIDGWIRSLSTEATPSAPVPALTANALDDWPTAVQWARAIGQRQVIADDRERVLQQAAEHPSPLVRDLFAGHQPANRQRVTLGAVVDPPVVLSLNGTAERGRVLFHETPGVQCQACHKLTTSQPSIGPDLREMVKKRSRAELLTSLLTPSAAMEPAYRTQIVELTSGRVLTGLIVRQDDKSLVLRESNGKDTVISVADIETQSASPQSLMPEGLLRDLTAQEAADLLAYLESLKAATVSETDRQP